MHGLGNDFIVLDCRRRTVKGIPALVRRLSRRRFSVGFDQALVLRGSRSADFKMDIYNSDGARVEMCGNGIRCLAAYIWKRRLSAKKQLSIETLAGVIRAERAGEMVRVDMGSPILEGRLIPAAVDDMMIVDRPLRFGGKVFTVTCVSMGNPHCVIFVDDVDGFPVEKFGPVIEGDRFFPKGTNVEFVEILSKRRIKMRVWERGTGETLACGTGAAAAAVAAYLNRRTGRRVKVMLRGGALDMEWKKSDDRVYMTGPAVEVFEGVAAV